MENMKYKDRTIENAEKLAKECLDCKLCMKECIMMDKVCNSPQEIFERFAKEGEIDHLIPYSCNMCDKCVKICPKNCDIPKSFMEMREDLVASNNGESPIKAHGGLEMHQKLGFGSMFNMFTTVKDSKSRLDGKKIAYMPGCSLPSYNPQGVAKSVEYLKSHYPDLAVIQRCCGKPTKVIGQADKFKERYSILENDFKEVGAEVVIVACQNCYKLVKECSPQIEVVSIWEVAPELGLPEELKGKGKDSDVVFTVHDSCPTRECNELHDGVRWVLSELGYKFTEPENTREETRCCGSGGMANVANREVGLEITKRRIDECNAEGDYILTYCSTCRATLTQSGGEVFHLLDLLYGPVVKKGDKAPEDVLSNPVKSWVGRYKSKQEINKIMGK